MEDTDKVIFVAGKPFGVYNKAILMALEKHKKITVKTRGKHILSAVNIVTFLARVEKLKIEETKLGGSLLKGKDDKERHIPEIEIIVTE